MTWPVALRAEAFGCDRWDVFFEFGAPYGIPDIVFATFSDEANAARDDATYTERRDAAVLLALHERRSLPLNAVAARTGYVTSSVASTLASLRELDAVEQSARGWRRLAPCPSRLKSAVAVELKLRDWRRALDQAARYRAFADKTFVVVDERRASGAAEHRFSFRLNDVGLATLTPWTVNIVVSPRRKRPFDPVGNFLAGERLWAAYRDQHPRDHDAAALALA